LKVWFDFRKKRLVLRPALETLPGLLGSKLQDGSKLSPSGRRAQHENSKMTRKGQ
jgi:hypothetical protein